MGHIFYIMGKSSSGKDSIYKEILKRKEELKTVTLYTTRPIREGEVEGVEYFFVGDDRCDEICEQGKVIELRSYDTVHGIWKYFTVDDGQFCMKESSYLMIGTLESYSEMRKYFPEGVLIPIYVEVEDGLRLQRALEREQMQEHPKYAELCRRFLADTKDFNEMNLLNNGIERRFHNLDFNVCIDEIVLYIEENI